MSHAPIEFQLEQIAAALKTAPSQTEAAWGRVWARVQASQAPFRARPTRWPLALSLSVVAAMFVVANVSSLGGYGNAPALSAAYLPVPAWSALTPTPASGTTPARAVERKVITAATVAPPVRSSAIPIPRPPDS